MCEPRQARSLVLMDRRFLCQDCGTKWFLHEHRTGEPDLTECGRCGGQLVRLVAPPASEGWGVDEDVGDNR